MPLDRSLQTGARAKHARPEGLHCKRRLRPMRRRVIAYVTRERDGRRELLVFEDPEHPGMGVQLPAGRLDEHESLEEGLARELEEETGLTGTRVVRRLCDPDEFK